MLRDARGGTAVIFAIAVPVIGVLACAALDLAQLSADRSAMQDAADATALAMAKQLGIATAAGITSRAQAYAAQELGAVASADHLGVATSIAPDNSSVTVALTGTRSSFFGSLLPPGGWILKAQATAATLGQLPLCVLSSGSTGGQDVTLDNTSQMTAPKCLVQSNQDITVQSGAALSAGLAQASGTASGPITPAAQTGAPTIPDPFASMTIINPSLLGLCSPADLVTKVITHDTLLWPGTHCGSFAVRNGATLYLAPGEHYFTHSQLVMQQNSTLTGANVVLVFDKNSIFNFSDSSTVTLSGRTSGTFAGFVIATTRDNVGTFAISSTAARKLEGTIYIPSATLAVSGVNNTVNDQAAWTVVIAQAIKMTGSANLVISASYATSSIPVPAGVGSGYSSARVTLTK